MKSGENTSVMSTNILRAGLFFGLFIFLLLNTGCGPSIKIASRTEKKGKEEESIDDMLKVEEESTDE